jgi:succinate dehydrogenase hydrophobic anchor subunit
MEMCDKKCALPAISFAILLAFYYLTLIIFISAAMNGGRTVILTNAYGEQAIELIMLALLTPAVTYHALKEIYRRLK